MSLTLRQFQKMISAAKKRRGRMSFPDDAAREDIEAFAARFWRKNLRKPHITSRGRLVDGFDGDKFVTNPASLIDSFVRKHGPNATIASLLQDEKNAANNPSNNSDEQKPDQNSEKGQPANGNGAGQSGGDGDQTSEPPAHNEPWVPTPPPPEPPPKPKTREEQHADTLRELREQFRKQKQTAAAGQSAADESKAQKTALKQLKNKIRSEAKKQSKTASLKGAATGPSLRSRRRAAGAHGRLQRVPVELRNKTAEIINRLVSETGVAGDRLSPIPVLSSRKVVKRMVVRRPLPNALKEDSNSGRPVTLFLPDVSPSCERQAQIACDISNAAGYAGVSGSDVLVFPHSNGCVEPDYVPWFNGRPTLVHAKGVDRLFREITGGTSKYDIRVVVAIGDHDAMELYGELAARKNVRRFVWLHNIRSSPRSGPEIVSATDPAWDLERWPAEAKAKTTLVLGCVNRESILTGLNMSIK